MRGGSAQAEADRDRRLVVSVHDVSPPNLAEVRWLLERLDALGARPRVLKVIPNEAGRAPVGEDQGLVDLLHHEATHGSEIVLHGYTHRAAGRLRGSAVDRLRARLFAGDTPEFLSVTWEEAARRIEAGRAALNEAGVPPAGFCPPAWLADGDLGDLLRKRGFRYLLTFGGLHDLERGRLRTMRAVGYMGAGPIQERLVAVERLLMVAASTGSPAAFPVLRVFLHPRAASRSPACSAVLRSLERLLRSRTPVTYAALLDH